MWVLDSDLFEGALNPPRKLLRTRTKAAIDENRPVALVAAGKDLSLWSHARRRKHITITVDNVPEGGGRNLRSRSTVTIEDLDSKKGTLLNGVQIRGQKKTLSEDVNEVKLGMCSKLIRIGWNPVVLSFSFTAKELRADPWTRLRDSLEQLDIKYSADYSADTTYVVSKKRNTSKGLQALINGKHVVADSFINAIVDAATVPDGAEEGTPSALEEDVETAWPNPLDYLPPRGEEPVERSPESYSPDERRQEVFDGYTFVFYESKQYENLFPAIAAGKGKALLKEVIPRKTDVDDFIRYVKGVAGEKGLGSFEDGSEGRGVVVVRYTPKGEDYDWFAQFLTSVAQRLDHRPIDQREFLEAILACDASMLRRPLEEASQPVFVGPGAQEPVGDAGDRMEVDRPADQPQPSEEAVVEPEAVPQKPRGRRAGRGRFKGFDFDDAEEPVEETPPVETPAPPQAAAASQDSLFVSQNQEPSLPAEEEPPVARATRQTRRKRPLSPLPEDDVSALMDEIAPTAAAAKRRRIESGQAPVPPSPEPEPTPKAGGDEEMVPDSPEGKPKKGQTARGKGKKIKEEDSILELARRQREEAEAQAAAKRRELEELPDDGIDYAAIRALHIIEECEVHFPEPGTSGRSRDQDIGEAAGRQAPRTIISLEEVKPKEYGIGDDYWLEEDEGGRRRKESQHESQTQTQQLPSHGRSDNLAKGKGKEVEKPRSAVRRTVITIDSSDEEDPSEPSAVLEESFVPESEPSRSRAAKAAEKANSQRRSQTQTQTQTQSQSQAASSSNKRSAPTDSNKDQAAKKPRRGFKPPSDDDSDDSDDELKFRFGRRR
ncbi:hypothetical protein CHGG_10861 [Chaetomium globosum CBS 148.51]|uniref:FHA domain-containing protein n=1 Tax=Chaetomium globosum (strain ATCC 6205 / CBS 148.51 / DSM 1962 / NBRC 6347 / NRRL 1970) TaxID=306901 RepID=Q2GME3_CHAGB|nr:uncharacterized protein CHGG_10861 [Chaetomium globosum CBS 148.51]EAQ83043.1 hypothetical protein CHGG_10861 [Chaetomium globosum CBS 148.51]